MGQHTEYRGYTIESMPRQPVPGKAWQRWISITFPDQRGVQRREFHDDSCYQTKQVADLHGFAYGQQIIDGLVDGLSVADMKRTDQRTTPRFRVQFRATICSGPTLGGAARILDLSLRGCRVESSFPLLAGMPLELRIFALGLHWPLIVEEAHVRWESGLTFGLAFVRLRDSERKRLEQVLAELKQSDLEV